MNSHALRRQQKGKVLKKLREKSLLSRQALAALSGTSVSTICRIERGEGNFQAYSVESLCRVFNIYPEQLLTLNIDAIDESVILRQVNHFLLRAKADQDTIRIVKNSRSTFRKPHYMIDELIDRNFFKHFRKVSEVRRAIHESYRLDIASSVLSNALKAKRELIEKPAEKGNHKLYKWAGKKL